MNISELDVKIKNCTKCRLSETRTNALCGEGNLHAKIMLIAQAPGEHEDREDKMFIGPSGKILHKLLKVNGINREEIYMTNLVKCMLPGYRKPKQDEINICSQYLLKEIEIINPSVLVPLGYYATKYIFEKYHIIQPSERGKFNNIYGKLFWSGEKKILPLQHPATLLYDSFSEKEIVKNYHKLKVVSHECKWSAVCPMKMYYEKGKIDRKWRELYCKGDWESCIRYQMEEEGKYHPDWMLPDGMIDKSLKF